MRKITLVISAIMQLRIKLSLPYFSRLLELYNSKYIKIKKINKKVIFKSFKSKVHEHIKIYPFAHYYVQIQITEQTKHGKCKTNKTKQVSID